MNSPTEVSLPSGGGEDKISVADSGDWSDSGHWRSIQALWVTGWALVWCVLNGWALVVWCGVWCCEVLWFGVAWCVAWWLVWCGVVWSSVI